MTPAGAAADLPAGVTEVMVIADESARADFVAADLLAQAEHGSGCAGVAGDARRGPGGGRRAGGASPGGDAVARAHPRGLGRRHAPARGRLARHGASPSRTTMRPSICCCRSASRGPGCRGSKAPERCFSEAGRRKPWATTAAGRITPCPPTDTPSPTAACRSRTSKSASPYRSSRRPASQGLSETAQVLARLEGLDGHAAAVAVRLAALAKGFGMNPLIALARPEIVASSPMPMPPGCPR